MKKLLILGAISGMTSVAVYAFPIYEPFDYDPGVSTNLIENTNPDGITWRQSGPDAGLTNQPYIDPGSLTYPGRPPARGNKVRFGGNGTSARFSFRNEDVAITGTLYYSFLFRINDSSTLNDTGIFWAGFNNTQGPQTGTPTVVGGRLITKNDTNAPGNFLVGLSKNSGNVGDFLFDPTSYTTNDVIFVVVGYTWIGDTSGGADFAEMWVNPAPSTFGATSPPPATITSFAGGDHGNFRSFVLFNRNAAEPNDVVVDELLIANNWADVTPGTNAMLAIPPKDQTVAADNYVLFETKSQLADSIQWQFNGTNIAGATNELLVITNAQTGNAGTYSVVYSNTAGTSVSNATLTVVADGVYPALSPLWSIAPGDRTYVTAESGGSPRQRYIAYSSLSNQVFVVDAGVASDPPDHAVYVLDGTTGGELYQLNTDTGVIFNDGVSTADRTLNTIDVGDDGALYAGNMTFNANARGYKLYRWDDSGSNTAPVKLLGPQEPAFSSTQHRWGDTLAVRGSGTNAEVVIDEDTAMYAALIHFDPTFGAFISDRIFTTNARPSLGRSLQFGPTNSFWQKARSIQYAGSGPLEKRVYEIFPGPETSFPDIMVDPFPSTVGPVAMDVSQNLLAGIDFSPDPNQPDALALYDISDLANPVLIARYDFPTNQQPNDNSFGRVVISGDRVYALNSNNGLMAFEIVPFAPELRIVRSGNNAVLSWTTNATGYSLESRPLVDSGDWTDLGVGTIVGDRYQVTDPITGDSKFYRLRNP